MSYHMRQMRFCVSDKEYLEALEKGREIAKMKRKLPKYKDLVVSAFDDLKKEQIEFDEYVDYIYRMRQSYGNKDEIIKAINVSLRNGTIVKVVNPLEKRLIMGHSYKLA